MNQYVFTACKPDELYPLIDSLSIISNKTKIEQDDMLNLLESLDMSKEEAISYITDNSTFSIVTHNILRMKEKSNINTIVLYNTVVSSCDINGDLIATVEKHNVYTHGNLIETYWRIHYSFIGHQLLLYKRYGGVPLIGDIIKLNKLGTTLVVTGYDQGKMLTRPTQNDEKILHGHVYTNRSIYEDIGWFVFDPLLKFKVISPVSIDVRECEVGFEIIDHIPGECLKDKSKEECEGGN